MIEAGEDTTEEDVSEAEYATDSEFETASSEDDDEDRKGVEPGPALRRSPRLKKKSEVCILLLTLLPGANAFQELSSDPDNWIKELMVKMLKKNAKKIKDGIMDNANSGF